MQFTTIDLQELMSASWLYASMVHQAGFWDELLFFVFNVDIVPSFSLCSVEGLDEVVEEDLELLHTEHTIIIVIMIWLECMEFWSCDA